MPKFIFTFDSQAKTCQILKKMPFHLIHEQIADMHETNPESVARLRNINLYTLWWPPLVELMFGLGPSTTTGILLRKALAPICTP
jgi:hypothetical protein